MTFRHIRYCVPWSFVVGSPLVSGSVSFAANFVVSSSGVVVSAVGGLLVTISAFDGSLVADSAVVGCSVDNSAGCSCSVGDCSSEESLSMLD